MTTIDLETTELLFGHTDEDSAYLVDDYPYGRKRTQIRYWIETVPKKGDRFCAQTLNPKTGLWNKPKKSTYMNIMVMTRAEDVAEGKGILKVRYSGLRDWIDQDELVSWVNTIGVSNLNEEQKKMLAYVRAVNKVYANVTFNVRSETGMTEERKAELDAEQAEIRQRIGCAVAGETMANRKEMGV